MDQMSPLNANECGIKGASERDCYDTYQNGPLELIRPRENNRGNVGADLEKVLPRSFGR